MGFNVDMLLFCLCFTLDFVFVLHRFRLKYHPEDSVKRKEEQMAALKVARKGFSIIFNKYIFFRNV